MISVGEVVVAAVSGGEESRGLVVGEPLELRDEEMAVRPEEDPDEPEDVGVFDCGSWIPKEGIGKDRGMRCLSVKRVGGSLPLLLPLLLPLPFPFKLPLGARVAAPRTGVAGGVGCGVGPGVGFTTISFGGGGRRRAGGLSTGVGRAEVVGRDLGFRVSIIMLP
jgi:hypothetical protein